MHQQLNHNSDVGGKGSNLFGSWFWPTADRMRDGMKKSDFNVCVIGRLTPSGKNKGVVALGTSLLQLIAEARPGATISVLSGDESLEKWVVSTSEQNIIADCVCYVNRPRGWCRDNLPLMFLMSILWRLVPLERFRKCIISYFPSLMKIAEADLVGDIRGGDSFSDIYGKPRLILGSLPAAIALLLKRRLIFFPQTYGPYKSNISKSIARFLLNRADCVLSRDMEGIQFVKKLAPVCDAKSRIDFCPDVAFVMDPIRPGTPDIVPALPSGQNVKLIGFNVNGLVYNGGYNRQDMFGLRGDYKMLVHGLALRLLETTDAHLLMVPHNFTAPGRVESDSEACTEVIRSLQNRFEGRLHIVNSEYGAQEIKGIIGMCDFFIGSRMHSCIAALSQGIPTVGIAYSHKFKGVFDSVGFGRMVMDARHMEPSEIITKIMETYENDVNGVASLQTNVREVKGKIREVFNRICRDTGSM